MRPAPDALLPGQESCWAYPRPAVLRPNARRVRIVVGGRVLADTAGGHQALETSHPPTHYLPPGDVDPALLRPAGGGGTACEWKGAARYFDVVVGARVLPRVAWSYPAPTPAFAAITDHLAFYAGPFREPGDEVTVDGEPVTPQAGGFYGGWITSRVAGPFKGGPGTMGW